MSNEFGGCNASKERTIIRTSGIATKNLDPRSAPHVHLEQPVLLSFSQDLSRHPASEQQSLRFRVEVLCFLSQLRQLRPFIKKKKNHGRQNKKTSKNDYPA